MRKSFVRKNSQENLTFLGKITTLRPKSDGHFGDYRHFFWNFFIPIDHAEQITSGN